MPNFPAHADAAPESEARYAVYYAPAAGSALHAFGSGWLGRDADTGAVFVQPTVEGLSAERFAAVTESARHYGFHATLKPPFQLKPGRSEADLLAYAESFAGKRAAFSVELAVRSLGGFLALMQKNSRAEMQELAAACVRDFDGFRALPSQAELDKRRSAGLSVHQEEMLQRWGYPYVMSEFRFHMTLSDRMPEGEEKDCLVAAIAREAAAALAEPFAIDSISVFKQDDRKAPFRRIARFGFGA